MKIKTVKYVVFGEFKSYDFDVVDVLGRRYKISRVGWIEKLPDGSFYGQEYSATDYLRDFQKSGCLVRFRCKLVSVRVATVTLKRTTLKKLEKHVSYDYYLRKPVPRIERYSKVDLSYVELK